MRQIPGDAESDVNIGKFRFGGPSIAEDIRSKYGYDGDLLSIFSENTGAVVQKWHHYIPLYDRYFGRFRSAPVRFLEIGVSKGGSLQMWRKYFGPKAILYGIDIDPECAKFDGQAGVVRIGSQDDAGFLAEVVGEMGGVDIVLDDGSHRMDHIRRSLLALYPMLNPGGLYMIEDLHTAYSSTYGGAFASKENFFFDLLKIIDDMHRAYHGQRAQMPELGQVPSGIHVHDSIVVLEKGAVHRPVHSRVGER